jgi:Sulfate permease family
MVLLILSWKPWLPAPAGGLHLVRVIGQCASRQQIAVVMSEHSRDVVRMLGLVPGLRTISSYRREWLARDVVAGVVLTTLLVPQGMAYAELAGLPPITGLYTSILCLLGYAVFGPSRILSRSKIGFAWWPAGILSLRRRACTR